MRQMQNTDSVMNQGMSSRSVFVRAMVLGAFAVAFLFRVRQYLLNRSLWLDEAYLSLNIIHRSYTGLWQPLDYHQGAPIGFLMLEKSAVQLLGTSEFALRLFPLLVGVLSIFLFYKLANETIVPAAVAVALGLFAISPPLIYYSSEVKQYSSDVAIALLLYCLTIESSTSEWKPIRVASLALVGCIAIWVSHPSVFVLAGIGATILIALAARKDWSKLARISVAFLMWAVSFFVCYAVVLRKLAADRILLDYWKTNFMPFPPRSVTDFKWFEDSFFEFFTSSAGLRFTGLAALVFILGSVSLFIRNRERLFLLLSPAIATLFASGLHMYPFGGRLTLFLVPTAFLLMAEGFEAIRYGARTRLPVVGLVVAGLLFLDSGLYSLHHFAKPFAESGRFVTMLPEEIKPVMAYIRTHQQPDDLVYVFYAAQPAFEYYAERDGFPRDNVAIGTASGDDPRNYESDLDRLRGKRVWVLFSHMKGVGFGESRQNVNFYLDMMGQRLELFARAGAETDLYNLRGADRANQTSGH